MANNSKLNPRNYFYNVKNRSAGTVLYSIPEDHVRRRFMPGETKRICYEELLHLSYQPGGREMMANFLQIQSEGVPKSLGIKTEPEYYMSEQDVIDLLKTGSLAQFLDCLDFAPAGVIELVKKFAVDLPLADYDKRQALKNKTGFDVDAAISNSGSEVDSKAEAEEKAAAAAPASGRRTNVSYSANTEHATEETTTTAPRTPKYNVITPTK